ncbi:MAG TPA: permease prefix domain 1-containing protein [Ktedonobacteraceae bacterium]
MVRTIQRYLAQIQKQLPTGGSRRERILSEIETHLQESWEEEQRRDVPAEEALAHVFERFGSPALIGKQFACLEKERQLWQGQQCWQRACLFLAPLLFCYVIAALSFLGYDAPRQVFIHFTNSLGNGLATIHAGFIGTLFFGWLILGGPLACAISGTLGIITMKNWSQLTWLNLMWTTLGLVFLLFGLYTLITG